jgi:hypothetical protein
MRTQDERGFSADFDDILVEAEQHDANGDRGTGDGRGTRAHAELNGKRALAGERHGMLLVHPDAAVTVVHVTAVGTSSVLSNSAEGTAASAREHDRADIHLRLREIPAQNPIMDDVQESCDLRRGGDGLREATSVERGGGQGHLGSDTENIVRNAGRHAPALFQVRLGDRECVDEALALLALGGREDAVDAVGNRTSVGRAQELRGPDALLAEAEEVGRLLHGDRGDRSAGGGDKGGTGNTVHGFSRRDERKG